MALIDLLPDCYKNNPQVVELQGAFKYWTEALQAAKEDLFLQMNVETATWGLEMWEKALGLETDASKSYEYRRTRIMSKLRGSGTTTKAMIQNVAESFSNGKVVIIEYNDESRFEVKFVSIRGIPPNLDDLKNAINEIKPAHIAINYEFTYTIWNEVKAITWDQVKVGLWDDLMTRKVV